ncbi:MAG TPA: DUF368 domain-containing protein [Planctomycetaceae bacterium]|nr:DUF368 domain-containing protein [Planctomycetaceae bacterium]
MSNNSSGFSGDAINWLRGLCMGAADIIPGVSGGTVALILGHYERLVSAIANIDVSFVRQMLRGNWAAGLNQIDARFLIGLGSGIATGIIGLASLIHYLLVHQQAYVFSLFVGMILASSYLVAKRLGKWSVAHVVLILVGAVIAWQICRLTPMQSPLNPLTAFLSAVVAICAMILPGISGAFVLLVLGMYHPITELLRGLPKGQIDLTGLVILTTFVLGCLVGLLSFSRLLRWLLAKRHDDTMAVLVGLMLGSIYKIWPFQRPTAATAELPFKEQEFEMLWPGESSASGMLVLGLLVAGVIITLLMESVGTRLGAGHAQVAEDH